MLRGCAVHEPEAGRLFPTQALAGEDLGSTGEHLGGSSELQLTDGRVVESDKGPSAFSAGGALDELAVGPGDAALHLERRIVQFCGRAHGSRQVVGDLRGDRVGSAGGDRDRELVSPLAVHAERGEQTCVQVRLARPGGLRTEDAEEVDRRVLPRERRLLRGETDYAASWIAASRLLRVRTLLPRSRSR